MKSGYDQFFKDARKAASGQSGARSRSNLDHSLDQMENQIRQRMRISGSQKKKRALIPWRMVGVSFLGFIFAIWGFQNYEKVEGFIQRVEIQILGEAVAQPSAPTPPPAEAAAVAPTIANESQEEKNDKVSSSAGNIDHFKKLNERKKELDAREEELNRMESELHAQKEELEKRLKELESMRTKISNLLDDRVKADDQKVDTLVQMYTNMKAPQAAKIFETMDEDLAVEILGRMKKKNAADIMNLLKPEKAQTLSEMFAGYKRRTPASQ